MPRLHLASRVRAVCTGAGGREQRLGARPHRGRRACAGRAPAPPGGHARAAGRVPRQSRARAAASRPEAATAIPRLGLAAPRPPTRRRRQLEAMCHWGRATVPRLGPVAPSRRWLSSAVREPHGGGHGRWTVRVNRRLYMVAATRPVHGPISAIVATTALLFIYFNYLCTITFCSMLSI